MQVHRRRRWVSLTAQGSPYRTFGRPFGRVFAGALLSYQLLYWGWLKLAADEERVSKNSE